MKEERSLTCFKININLYERVTMRVRSRVSGEQENQYKSKKKKVSHTVIEEETGGDLGGRDV